jgi:hypothetical protein
MKRCDVKCSCSKGVELVRTVERDDGSYKKVYKCVCGKKIIKVKKPS